MEKAQDKDKITRTILAQFTKTGKDIFDFNVTSADCEYFFPISAINAWRRQLILSLEDERLKRYVRRESKIIPSSIPYLTNEIDFTANVSNHLSERFYCRHGVKQIERSVETGTVPQKLMYNKYCIKFELGMCPLKQGAPNSGNLFLRYSDKKLKLHFDCKKCEMSVENEL
jgi:putative protease